MPFVRAGGRPTNDAAIRLHTVIDDPLCSPLVTLGCRGPRYVAWSSPKTIES